jgi:carbon monoxide dehydrogenase subunit G
MIGAASRSRHSMCARAVPGMRCLGLELGRRGEDGLMKIAGDATAHGSVEAVWAALHDAAVLASAIPGCQHFEVSGPGLAQFIATAGLPAISGTYSGKLTVVEQQRPNLLRLTASATGDQGIVSADVTVRLSASAAAGTLVSYEANGTVTGPLAAVGARLLASAAKRVAGDFFAAIDASVGARPATAAIASARAEPVAAAAPAARPAPRAVARPGPLADNRVALVAGATIGLAGVVIGVLAGRSAGKHGGGRAGRVQA